MLAQFIEREIAVRFEVRLELRQLLLTQAGRVPAAMWLGRKLRALTMQPEHLFDESSADAKQLGNFCNRAFAAFDSGDDTLA